MITGYLITAKQYFNKNKEMNAFLSAFRLLSKVKAAKHTSRTCQGWCLSSYAAFGTGRNYRKSEFRLVNFVRSISFLVFPSRHVGRETPHPSCVFGSLDLAEQTKSRQKYRYFFVCFFIFIKILLGSNKITSYR